MGTDESPDPQPGTAPDEEDDTRRKFREALTRKQSRDHVGGTTGAAAQHPHAAPAKRSRTFRRKSG